METENVWYSANGCQHAHCPMGCDKPQPQLVSGRMLCMKCYCIIGIVSEMVPCVPETCGE